MLCVRGVCKGTRMPTSAIAKSWENRTVRGMEPVTPCTLKTVNDQQILLIQDEDLAERIREEFSVYYDDIHGCFAIAVTSLHTLLLTRLRAEGLLEASNDSVSPPAKGPAVGIGVIQPGVGGAPWRVRMRRKSAADNAVLKGVPGVTWDPGTGTWLCSVGTRPAVEDLSLIHI